MERRVLFKKGEQRKFLELVVKKLNTVSVRSLLQFGFDVNYSSLKNYYTERRLIPENLFTRLCNISNINTRKFKIKYINNNWGQIKGGKNKSE